MIECKQEERKEKCACSYISCTRRGKCCECIEYHLQQNQLPGCVFYKISEEAERSYNRDFEYFANLILERRKF